MDNLLSTVKSVSEIVDDFQSENLAIPEIQRDVVWSAEQTKDLIDSISQSYPCGALIYWEPREKDKQLVRSMIRPERLASNKGRVPRYFLLDGQQRVTALASVLLPRARVRELLAEMEDELPSVFANLKRFPREFEATSDPAGYRLPWMLFNKLFDSSWRDEAASTKLPASLPNDVQRYVQRVRDYKFPVQIISNRDYPTVGEIFTRVNSAGTQLTGAEIHLARIVPYWRGITSEFREYRRELAGKNYDLDLTFLMRALTVVECNVPQIKKLADKISKDAPSRVHLNRTWKQARGAVDRTVRILDGRLGLDKSKFITSKNALVPLLYSLAKGRGGKQLESEAVRFFIFSQLAEHYSAAAETQLRRDFRGLTDATHAPTQALGELVKTVMREARQYYPGLKIRPSDVRGVPSRNKLVLLMYILMRQRGATDWGAGKRQTLDGIEPRDTQLHHIFPFDYMNKNATLRDSYLDDGFTPADYRNDVNDISNLTFLSQGKNIDISDTPPSQYLPIETTKEMRRAHFIPEAPDLWKAESFRKFLDERRKLLSKGMSSFLKNL